MTQSLLKVSGRQIITDLTRQGAMSYSLLSESNLRQLREEAIRYPYVAQPVHYGNHGVKQELSSFSRLPSDSRFLQLAQNVSTVLREKFAPGGERFPFTTPLEFNEFVLQQYQEGSAGITPHRDMASYRNLIVIIPVMGHGTFTLYDDREGTNPIDLDGSPGNIILMRGPGFLGSTIRPFHSIHSIRSRRISFAMRQNRSS